MLVRFLIMTLLLCAGLLVVIDYQKRCIEDLETRQRLLRELQIEEVQEIIKHLKSIQNENFEHASKDTIMRNTLNELTVRYAEQKRKLDE